MKRPALVVLTSASLAAVLALGTHGRYWRVPDPLNPLAPLVVGDEPNWLTPFKLSRLSHDPDLCRAVLRDSSASAAPVADMDAGHGCGWTDAVRFRGTAEVGLSAPTVMSCREAVSLALWIQHEVQPSAIATLGQSVRRIEHLGSYACRNVNNAQTGSLSRHAKAEALDVAAFTLQDGTRVSVLRDWKRSGDTGRFLHQVHDGACRWFDGVLGPDFNRQHVDHFHLERGAWNTCR
jgi:hypothetical protein